jgi:hypothetical protein
MILGSIILPPGALVSDPKVSLQPFFISKFASYELQKS